MPDMDEDNVRRVLGRMYLTPGLPGAMSGVEIFSRIAKKRGFKKEQVKRFLEGLDVYTKHAPVKRKHGDVERVISGRPFDLWEADLMDTKSVIGGKQNLLLL